MSMTEGVVTIDPSTGATTAKTGAAGAVFDALDAGTDYGDLESSNPTGYAAAREQVAVMARTIAVLIPYLVANAEVSSVVAAGIAVEGGETSETGTASGTIE
jgi:hypothetical protein